MRILALDAATEVCSVALLVDGGSIVRSIESGKSSSQQLLSLIDEVTAEAQISLAMLDGIAASIGPGAFTGVRISVAVAQGLAFGLSLPVVPVTTLEALAMQVLADGGESAVACLDARMGEVYWGRFSADAAQGVVATAAPQVSPPAAVALALGETVLGATVLGATVPGAAALGAAASNGRRVGIGRGFSVYPELARIPGIEVTERNSLALPNAREFARLGALRLALGGGLDPADLQPLYLRDKVALTEAERAVQSTRQPA
jgi:tRNA threonylcarbamoyladenosine biosynthesis protein TsaB